MSFSAGTYSLPGAALNTGDTVSATENNTLRNDMASSFNLTWLRDGSASATANIPLGGFKLTGIGAATTTGDALSYGRTASVTDLTYTTTLTGGTGIVNLGSGQFYKDASGNVGIGTSSVPADAKVAIVGTGLVLQDPAGAIQRFNKTLGTDTGWLSNRSYGWHDGNGIALSTQTADALKFGTNSAERARIDSSGNLLVGATSFAYLNNNNVLLGAGGSAGQAIVQHISGTASGSTYAAFTYNAGAIGSIIQNGTTGVLYNLTSDYRLKNNQQPLTGAKEFVMALQPKKWEWWDGSGEGVGFIAHEFMEVAKYSGHGEKDAVDEEGKIIAQSIQPSSSEVMANLVSLLQEQQALIENLTTRLASLEGAK